MFNPATNFCHKCYDNNKFDAFFQPLTFCSI